MTKIEWTDTVWNVVTGCTKIASGCKHCYAARMANRLRGRYGYPIDDPFRVTLHPDRLEQSLRWQKPRMVFVCSMGDLFHDDVPDHFIAAVFGVMAATQQHTYQVLTKRPDRMRDLLSRINTDDCVTDALGVPEFNQFLMPKEMDIDDDGPWGHLIADPPEWPLPNVWLGTSASTQRDLDANVPHLLSTPAAVRFLSLEPCIAPINVRDALHGYPMAYGDPENQNPIWEQTYPPPNWVIVGSESGPRARPMHPQWARDIRDQCVSAGVSVFIKQIHINGDPKRLSKTMDEWPEDMRVRQMPEVKL